jgi:cell division septation protein DedD/nucleoid DNA-binding protein
MDINHYISELLFQRESVILPGFGEFKTIVQPASRNDSGKILPPARMVTFNPSAKANDYVLARYVSEKLKTSILKGNEAVRDYVNALLETLEKEGKISIAGIGEFVQANNLLSFYADESVNYDITSFGLEPASAEPVKKPEVSQKTTPEPIIPEVADIAGAVVVEEVDDALLQPAEPRRKRKRGVLWLLLLLLLLLAGAAWVYLNQDKAAEWYAQGIAYFAGDHKAPEEIAGQDQLPGESSPEEPAMAETTPVIDTAAVSEPADAVTSTPARSQQEKSPAQVAAGQYAIIAGCFGDQKNADKMVGQLQSQGFSASIEGKTSTGLFRVAAGLFPSADEAQKSLKQANADKKLLNAWVLKL